MIDNQETLSQSHLADSSHMLTSQNGQTDWYDRSFVIGMNRWVSGSPWHQLSSPTTQRLTAVVAQSIDHNKPVAVSTVEYNGQAHYNFHPSFETIGHWILIRGYEARFTKLAFDDPSANSPALSSNWDNGLPRFEADTASFNSSFIAPHGIAYSN